MKKRLLVLMSVVLLVVLFAFSASAETLPIKQFETDSTFRPVDCSSHKSVSSVTLYGNVDFLCMKAYSETNKKERFCLEVYSDSKRTKQIMGYSNSFPKGTTYEELMVDLTELDSGTYYATSYVKKEDKLSFYGELKKDPDSVVNFKLVVSRKGTTITKMKSVIYGYENSVLGPVIYWYSVPGADGYYVYRYVDGKYKKIATVKANGEEFSYYTDTAKAGVNGTAYYKIKAYSGSKTTANSDTLKAYLLKTPTVKASVNSSGYIKISWNNVGSSCRYEVYRRTADSNWKKLTSSPISNRYYNDYSVKNDVVYYYTVIAYNNYTLSGHDPFGAEVRFIAKPNLKSAKASGEDITVTWDAVSGSESYIVYRKEAGTGWKVLGETVQTSFTDIAPEKNKLYTYTVRAVNNKLKGPYNSTGVSGAVIDVPVLNEIEKTSNGSLHITWNDLGDNVKYKVYVKDDSNNGWTLLRTVSNPEYTHNQTFTVGRRYTYTVRAVVGNISGGYDKEGKSYTYLDKLKNLSVYNAQSGIGLKWNAAANAEGYNIYRKSADGEYSLLATVNDAYFEDKTAIIDTAYTYKITYIFGGSEKNEYAAEKCCKLASPIILEQENARIDDLRCYIRLPEFDAQANYTIYKKNGELWEKMSTSTANGSIYFVIDKNAGSFEWTVGATYSDGTVTKLPDAGFTFEYFEPATITVKANQNDYSVTVSWAPIEGAEKYNVYLGGKCIATVDASVSQYTQPDITPNTNCWARVGAVKNDIENLSRSGYSYLVKKVEIENISLTKDGVKLTWDVGNGDLSYIYRKAEGETTWTRLKTTTQETYTDNTAADGTTYYYCVRVRAYDNYSAYPETGTKITYIKAPKITDVKLSGKAATITWQKSADADYYIVYRKVSGGGWKTVYTTADGDTVSYKDSNVVAGTKYTYAVRAVKGTEKSQYISKTITFLAAPTVVSAKKTTDGIKVTFKQSAGATSYRIYRKTSGDWVYIGKAGRNATTYVDKTAKVGVKYTYTVKACSGTVYSSNYSGKSCTR